MLAELILFSENPAVMLADYKTESIIPKGSFQPVLKIQKNRNSHCTNAKEAAETHENTRISVTSERPGQESNLRRFA